MTIDFERLWAGVGLVGQGVFTARFAVQWLASERKRETVIPVAFWWLSLAGGLITLTYAIHLQSLSFSLGQSMGLFVYIRNLRLVAKSKRRALKRQRLAEAAGEGDDSPQRGEGDDSPQRHEGHKGKRLNEHISSQRNQRSPRQGEQPRKDR